MQDGEPAEGQQASGSATTVKLVVSNSRGLHARASAKFVKCAEQFDAQVNVSRDGQTVPGTSIMGLMMLGAQPGSTILIEAAGRQAPQVVAALTALVEGKFGEE